MVLNTNEKTRLSAAEWGQDPWALVFSRMYDQLHVMKIFDPWDDLLVAMWEAEQAGFGDWDLFKKMLQCHAVNLACIDLNTTEKEFLKEDVEKNLRDHSNAKVKDPKIPAKERDFWSIFCYVDSLTSQKLKEKGPVPRSMEEFRNFAAPAAI